MARNAMRRETVEGIILDCMGYTPQTGHVTASLRDGD